MLKYLITLLIVVSAACAVSSEKITGSGVTAGAPVVTDTREELIFEQGDFLEGTGAWDSMWYENPGIDAKVADNFQVGAAFDGYRLTRWEIWILPWYGTWDSTYGAWICIWEDGGPEPATNRPNETDDSGWHADTAAGNGGLSYGGITGLVAADYWEFSDLTGTDIPDIVIGPYQVYKIGASIEDCASGGWHFSIDSASIYWFATQLYANPLPYAGPTDTPVDVIPPGIVQYGYTGSSWNSIGYPMMYDLYGELIDDDDPYVTDQYPLDGDFPSGVPVDVRPGCHWVDDTTNINLANSTFTLTNGGTVNGSLFVEDTDPMDVIVEFEPDDELDEGTTYTVETYTEDLAGNNATETWDFTTGYAAIKRESLGLIKAGFAE
ncbi:MAG: hypothetical protein JSW52_07600 [Candidatus Coatesbacteria bacterium]|nr:MAG: hypothetical protein JSW52_07600 [Candidatus Coatesbacteria bacterium]